MQRVSLLAAAARHVLSLTAVSLAGVAINARADDSAAAASASAASSASTASAAAQNAASNDGTVLPTVNVEAARQALPGDLSPAYAGGQVATGAQVGILGQQKVIDLPFSVTSYTSKLIEDQQAHTLADVVANDPAVRSAYGYGNFSENYIIRGFEVYSDDVALNGLYGITPRQLVATEALERVDIFKGANAFVNGVAPGGSGVGGNINLETKYAADKPLTRVTLEGSASGELGTHVDVGRRFGDNDQFGIRVNQTVEGGETSIDGEKRHTQQTAIALDYRGNKFRVFGDFIYQKQHVSGGRPVVYVTGDSIPTAPSATSNYGQSWSYTSLEDTVGMIRAEYDLSPTWTAYVSGGVRHSDEHGDYASPSYGTDGATTAYRMGTAYKQDAQSGEVGLRGKFDTGPVSHAVNIAALVNRVESKSAYDFGATYSTSLYNTQAAARPAGYYSAGDFDNPGVVSESLMRSVALSDTMGFFGNRFLFTAGVRHQNILENGYAYGTGVQSTAYNESATTPIFGAVYKILPNLSVYANRSESLTEGGTAPSTAANANAILAPYRAKQLEAGIKYDANNYGAALAVYQIKQQVAYTDATTMIYGADGIQRHRGVELSAYGEPMKGLRLIGGVSFIDARLEDTNSGTEDGNHPIGVPAWTANANVEYDLPQLQGVTLMARAIYTSKQYLDEANTMPVAAWTRFDVGARYKTQIAKHDTVFRLMVTNVANRSYWSSALGGYLTEAAPRTAWLSLTTDF
ncbi:TonB-dependent receptor [Paraburkholderia sp.]|uniref:TonB-dependent receptor n=1 Tax=Paraburkholderia sp. TaxID=1926495 RepID=UPI002384966D|nr:TonB-dependent receptor [Paraburkholderia sp.]MDE1182157.1 TonB-dependent receptor [Paraburkholderia sp.]